MGTSPTERRASVIKTRLPKASLPKKRMATSRDMKILNFINDFGFCTIGHIQRCFNLKQARSYQIMQRLEKKGLVQHEMVFHNKPGFYWLTRKGALDTPLHAADGIPEGNITHQLTIIDVYLKLRRLHPDATWISERQLEHAKFSKGLGQKGHLSDGILLWPDNKKIAIEIELTMKGSKRLDQILKEYRKQFGIVEVWYYCDPSIIKSFQVKVAKRPYIKVFDLRDFLAC